MGASTSSALARAVRWRCPPGEGDAAFAHDGFVLLGEVENLGVNLGLLGGLLDFGLLADWIAVANIIFNRGAKQKALLGHVGDRGSQITQPNLGDIQSVQEDLTGCDIKQAGQQVRQGRFARADWTHYGDRLSRLNREVEILDGCDCGTGVGIS